MNGKNTFLHDRLIESRNSDPYRGKKSPPGNSMCKGCGTVYDGHRWTWKSLSPASGQHPMLCPACRRIRDGIPAGEITVAGDFYVGHRDEIENRIRNLDETEKQRHPLERIMSLERNNGSIRVTTTGVHAAYRIAEGLQKSYKGELVFSHPRGEQDVRFSWRR